jgi:hypothetical protein
VAAFRFLAVLALTIASPAFASWHGGHAGHSGSGHYSTTRVHEHTHRDPAQRRAFQREHACPSTGKTSGACPGYVVDHVQALKHGGADSPGNMQWQTVQDAKAKDRVE